jgi:hypothetical protein
MTESDWLAGKPADEMLEAVADRLTARRWRLLGAAFARKLWELLPTEPLRDAVEFVERTDPISPADAAAWQERIAGASDDLIAQARDAIRGPVRGVEALAPADPDVAPEYPSEVLHRAAVGFAQGAIHNAGEAVTFAADAIRLLFDEPGPEAFDQLLDAMKEADSFHASARQSVVNARKMSEEGDAYADRYVPRNARLDMAKAEETVRRLEQGGEDDPVAKRDRLYNKLLARYLQELAGNPFRAFRFDPRWRTSTVLDLARTIRDDRAFDRMPILADALLDADCDEEAVLRHCRGTEKHAGEKPQHLRGCWVLDLILAPDDPLFTAGPVSARKRKPRDSWL